MHPQLIQQYKQSVTLFEQWLEHTRYVGGIGLDGSRELNHTYQEQLTVFANLLAAVAKTDWKILTVHTRAAAAESILYLHNSDNRVILH